MLVHIFDVATDRRFLYILVQNKKEEQIKPREALPIKLSSQRETLNKKKKQKKNLDRK